MDVYKRKRDSSNSSTSSNLLSKRTVTEDILNDSSIQTDNSVFSTPAPVHHETAAPSLSANVLVPDSIQESPASHSLHSSAHSRSSIGSMSDIQSNEATPPTQRVISPHLQQSLANRDAQIDAVASNSAELITRFPDPNEAKLFLANLMKVNNDEFRHSVNDIVKDAMDERFALFESRIVPQIKQDVYTAVKFDMDTENANIRQELAEMRMKYNQLEEKLSLYGSKSVENDQYARRYTFRIRGINEHPNEDLKYAVCHIVYYQLNIQIQLSDIEVVHRAGVKQQGKSRIILCRLKDRGLKYTIMMQRRNLKGTGIVFEEDLCREYDDLLYNIKSHPNVSRAWSWNGKVMAEDRNGDRHTLKFGRDWVSFFDNLSIDRRQNHRISSSGATAATATGHPTAFSAESTAAHPFPTLPPPPPPPENPPSSVPQAPTVSSTATPSVTSVMNVSTAVTSTQPSTTSNSGAFSTSVSTAGTNTQTSTTDSLLGPIASVINPVAAGSSQVSLPAQSVAPGITASSSQQNQVAPLQIPLRDLGQFSSKSGMGVFAQPPLPARLSAGAPNITYSPRRSRTSTPLGVLPGIQPLRTKSPRTPRGQAIDRQPLAAVSPNIASYFTKPP